jgi:hypothetical protein
MCGGKSSNKALDAQTAADNQKQADITSGTAAVNAAFNNPQRTQDINSFTAATQGILKQALDKQSTEASRNTKFALARNGQTMGSVDVDQNAKLADDYNSGLLKVTQAAQAAGQRVKAADAQTQQQLTSLVQTGLDSQSAAQQALSGMRTNIATQQAAVDPTTLGTVFGDLGDFYSTSTANKAYNDANRQTQALYGNNSAYKSF